MDGRQRLAEVFVELADTLVDQFDTVDFLQMLCDRCVELLDAAASGLMLADQRGMLRLMAVTTEEARLLELFELQIEEGPCLDCFASGQAITNVDIAQTQQRWPRFAAAAREDGFSSTHALPLRLRGQVIGALNLFSAQHNAPMSDSDLLIGQAMADIATIGLLHERNSREQTALSEQLQTALHSRVLVEQAKGVLAARAQISVGEAFTVMRAHARRRGLRLTDVATAVVQGSIDVDALTST